MADHLGDHEARQRFFREARVLKTKDTFFWGALYDFGFEDEAAKELANYIAWIKNSQNPNFLLALEDLAVDLAQLGRYTEAVAVAKMITNEEKRFWTYGRIINDVYCRLLAVKRDEYDIFGSPCHKPFSSKQEILDIAELLTDEPDGKSLEAYRKKIRRYAYRYAENLF